MSASPRPPRLLPTALLQAAVLAAVVLLVPRGGGPRAQEAEPPPQEDVEGEAEAEPAGVADTEAETQTEAETETDTEVEAGTEGAGGSAGEEGEEDAAAGDEEDGAAASPPAGADATAGGAEPTPKGVDLAAPVSALEEALGFAIDGSLSGRYRLRFSPGAQDQDIYQNAYVRLGKPESDPISAVFMGRLSEDIDGHPRDRAFGLYDDVSDSYSSNVNGRFYQGYVDLQRLALLDDLGLERVRAGRQTYDETADTLIFDGGRLDSHTFEDLANLRLTAYGGLPVHYFESSPWGDAVAGAGLELAPLRRTRLRLDWTYVQDRQGGDTFHDHLVSAAVWQSWQNGLSLHGRYNLLGNETRDYFVRGDYRNPELDLFLQASFRHLVTTLRDLSLELDRYYELLREFRPYWQAGARVSKGITEHFVMDAGFDMRELIHEDDAGLYNHEFTRWYVIPATRDFPFPGMSIALTAEVWDSDDDDYLTFGGELSQKALESLEFSAGTYYSLYKLDRFSEDEKTRVRTYFGRIDFKLTRALRLRVLYELEKDDFTTYNTLETSFTYSF